ncbi:unnamed protein product [Scytosiphon promiscuus]
MRQVELSEDDARCLFQKLDSDRDGALGAEDLLRGAPTVASSQTRELRVRMERIGRFRPGLLRTPDHAEGPPEDFQH